MPIFYNHSGDIAGEVLEMGWGPLALCTGLIRARLSEVQTFRHRFALREGKDLERSDASLWELASQPGPTRTKGTRNRNIFPRYYTHHLVDIWIITRLPRCLYARFRQRPSVRMLD